MTNKLATNDCVLNKKQQEELLLGYVDHSLSSDTRRSYERHLTACAQCQELVALHKSVEESLEDWATPEVSSNFDAQLFARIRSEDRPVTFWQSLFGDWQWMMRPALPLALIAFSLIAVLAYRATLPEMILENQARLEDTDLPQVERALEDMEALHALSVASMETSPENLPEQPQDVTKKSL